MKLTKNQNHGLEGLNDYTDFSSVKSNNPCHQENPKNQGSDNMKQGWKIKKLGEVCDFENGDRGKNYPNKSHRVSLGIPFINAGHLNDNRLDFSEMDYISEERFNMLGNGKIKPNDILFCLRGSLGKVANVGNLDKGAIASSLVILRVRKELDNDFLLYFLNSDLTTKQIVDFGNGAAQPNLSAGSLKKFIIPLPPLPEQQRIVSILDECFAAIDKAKANAEQNLKNAKELFESYLQGVFERKSLNRDSSDLLDDPDSKNQKKSSNQANQKNQGSDYLQGVFERKSLNRDSSDLLDDPDSKNQKKSSNQANQKNQGSDYLQGVFENGNWETKTIEAVCNEIFAGGDAPKNNFSLEPNEKHSIPIYANAVKDRGLYGYTDFARVTKPCVTISARGSGTGHTELRDEAFLPIVRLIVCIPDTNLILNEFLKYTIDNLVIQRSGSAIPQLTVPMIKDYKIPVPTIEEQIQLIEKAETLRAETQKLEAVYQKKIADLEELKKSILQKAFAGELETEKAVVI